VVVVGLISNELLTELDKTRSEKTVKSNFNTFLPTAKRQVFKNN